MPLFIADKLNDDFAVLDQIEIPHIFKVLRKGIGDKIQFTDGKGNLGIGEITNETSSTGKITLVNFVAVPAKKFEIELLVAPPKNQNRFDMMIEKCVELGTDRIQILSTSRTERKRCNLERVNKIIRAASKQSNKINFTKCDTIDIQDINNDHLYLSFIASCSEIDSTKTLLSEFNSQNLKCRIMIGPEGDFSLNEIELAKVKGFKPIKISDEILRTETAAISSIAIINALYSSKYK